MVRLKGVTKLYGDKIAVNNLNLNINKGEIYSFLGLNGAGKTTTIKIMTTSIQPSEGEVIIDGYDARKNNLEIKKIMGYLPDVPFLYERLTGIQFLRFISDIFDIKKANQDEKINNLIKLFELEKDSYSQIKNYSFGMKKKISLCGVLVHNPRVLFLDEPINGLDPKSAKLIKDILIKLKNEGITIFLSTHLLDFAQEVSDRVGIIHKGVLVEEINLDQNKRKLEDVFLEVTGGYSEKEILDLENYNFN